jgi:hypothetical protein
MGVLRQLCLVTAKSQGRAYTAGIRAHLGLHQALHGNHGNQWNHGNHECIRHRLADAYCQQCIHAAWSVPASYDRQQTLRYAFCTCTQQVSPCAAW